MYSLWSPAPKIPILNVKWKHLVKLLKPLVLAFFLWILSGLNVFFLDSSSSLVLLFKLVEDGSVSGSKSLRFARMATSFSTLALVSLLQTFVSVCPNLDQLRSEAADGGGIWRMMEATGARASDPQSPFHQVDADMCWHDCHIPSPYQRPCLVLYLARLPRTLPSFRPRWWDMVVIRV